MAENIKTFNDYVVIFKRDQKWLFGTASLILIVSFLVAVIIPATYESSGTILIEQQEIPKDLVRSSITSFADQRIQIISQRVMTRSNLLEVIRKFDIYSNDRGRGVPTETIIENMRKDITMQMISADVVDPRSGRPTQATIAFSVSFRSRSSALAQKVANELVSLYLNENLKSRARLASDTSSFIADEVMRISKTMLVLETKLADFKKDNLGSLPEMASLNQQLYDRAERESFEVDRQISSLKERKIYLSSQLAQVDPYSSLFADTGERILSPTDRLKSLQSKYLSMSAVYGPDLPDLIKMRREIAALKKEVGVVDNSSELQAQLQSLRGELAVTAERYGFRHPDVMLLQKKIANLQQVLNQVKQAPVKSRLSAITPDNPAYIQLQAQFEAAESDLRSQIEKKKKLENKLTLHETRLLNSPEVERVYRALMRDYENTLIKYREIKAKESQTQLSESLETQRKGERFTLIEPPQFPEKPIKPNRGAIMLLGFIFAIGSGFGVTILRDSISDTIKSKNDIEKLSNVPLLTGISFIEDNNVIAQAEQPEFKRLYIGATAAVCLVSILLLAHFFYKPLDVTWFVLLRKIGL